MKEKRRGVQERHVAVGSGISSSSSEILLREREGTVGPAYNPTVWL